MQRFRVANFEGTEKWFLVTFSVSIGDKQKKKIVVIIQAL